MYRLRSKVADRRCRCRIGASPCCSAMAPPQRSALAARPAAQRPLRRRHRLCRSPPAGARRAPDPAARRRPRPRSAGLNATEDADGAAYHRLRIALGVPDAARDLTPEKSILLENGFDELNAIDWQKGCYMGQELTARTRYRGLVRKRLLPVRIEGAAPAPGTPLMLGDQELGEMRSASADGTLGLAMVRLEALAGDASPTFRAGAAKVVARHTRVDEASRPGRSQGIIAAFAADEVIMPKARLRDLGITLGQIAGGTTQRHHRRRRRHGRRFHHHPRPAARGALRRDRGLAVAQTSSRISCRPGSIPSTAMAR